MTAEANRLTITYLPQHGTPLVEVHVLVEGENDGLLNFDLSATGLVAAGVDSTAVRFTQTTLGNLRSPDFQQVGFPASASIQGPSGADDWSAGASQFNVANPIVGLGRVAILAPAALGPPDNEVIDVPFVGDPTRGSHIGTIDLGTEVDLETLRGMLGGGGTVFANGDPTRPIAPDEVTISLPGRPVLHGPPLPEPIGAALTLGTLIIAAAAGNRRPS